MRVLKVNKENTKNILSDLLKRSPNNYDQYAGTVQGILDEIKEKGDEALFAYTEKFDKCKLTKDTLQVTEEEIKAAYEKVDDSLVEVIRKSLVNIREYHEKQKRNSWFDAKPDGTILGQKMTALASVGVYVPGGKAAYPSSVLMNIVPAKVAGVEKIVMVTPPNKDGEVTPATLVAANEAGATHIYKVGGAQAIGALAYGTESIEKVDKIVGPGNIYVALAKKAVYGHVSIDSIAGPSEILVLADDTANPHYVAADLLSQAEHDELASAILVTTSKTLGEKVQEEIEGYLKKLSRAKIIEKSLENFGYILEAETLDEALEVVGLSEFGNRLAKKYSLGMKQRLGLASALLGEPPVLILDEPTNGLDPAGIHEIRNLIKTLPKRYDCTVLISSHMLSEIELLADNIGILNHGRLLFEGSLDDLKLTAHQAGFENDNLEEMFLSMIDEDNANRKQRLKL